VIHRPLVGLAPAALVVPVAQRGAEGTASGTVI